MLIFFDEKNSCKDGGGRRQTELKYVFEGLKALFNSSEVWSAAARRSLGRCRRYNDRVDVVLFVSSPVGSASGLVSFGCGNGRWSMWTQSQAVKALRQVGSVAGVQAENTHCIP